MEAKKESLQSELLTGKQLVVRMQYDDTIEVTRSHLDNVLASIGQVSNCKGFQFEAQNRIQQQLLLTCMASAGSLLKFQGFLFIPTVPKNAVNVGL